MRFGLSKGAVGLAVKSLNSSAFGRMRWCKQLLRQAVNPSPSVRRCVGGLGHTGEGGAQKKKKKHLPLNRPSLRVSSSLLMGGSWGLLIGGRKHRIWSRARPTNRSMLRHNIFCLKVRSLE